MYTILVRIMNAREMRSRSWEIRRWHNLPGTEAWSTGKLWSFIWWTCSVDEDYMRSRQGCSENCNRDGDRACVGDRRDGNRHWGAILAMPAGKISQRRAACRDKAQEAGAGVEIAFSNDDINSAGLPRYEMTIIRRYRRDS